MKQLLVILSIATLLSCNSDSSSESPCKHCDSITVYGDIHMNQEDLESYKNPMVFKTQKWLYNSVNEDVVIAEGIPFSGRPYTMDSMYAPYGIIDSIQKAFIDNLMVNNLGTSMRFLFEGKKTVYGGEDDYLSNINSYKLYEKDPQNMEDLNEIIRLSDLRSKSIAKSAETIYEATGKKVAIIIGLSHLKWFEQNGYKVKYPPEFENFKSQYPSAFE
jgi:hypothetical protein